MFIATASRRSKPGSAASSPATSADERAMFGVDPLLDRDQALAQLLVLGAATQSFTATVNTGAGEVLPEQVEQRPHAGLAVVGQLARALAVALDPLLGEPLEGARDEVDAVREVVALRRPARRRRAR